MTTPDDPGLAAPPPTVRTTRVEVVDADGRVRLVLGELGNGGSSYGLAILDAGGRQRLWLALDPLGPTLGFDQDGNVGLQAGVNDPTADALHVGCYVHLADAGGRPVAGVRVDADGTTEVYLEEGELP